MRKPESLAFMNNKGGVGKTTLLANMAHFLSATERKRVLVVDLDPQCNATQLLLSDDEWDGVYGGDQRRTGARTILHALRNIQRGDSGIETDYRIYRSARFAVDIVPGHPSMALMEDRLSSSWEALLRGDLGDICRHV
jgi:cellulose biosynthesis protein BcsQ